MQISIIGFILSFILVIATDNVLSVVGTVGLLIFPIVMIALGIGMAAKNTKANSKNRKRSKKRQDEVILPFERTAKSGSIPFAVIVDVETTGLLVDDSVATRKKVVENPDWYPRIVQIAWLTFDRNYDVVDCACHLIKQEGPIPQRTIDIHGITNEMCDAEGIELRDSLIQFREHTASCDYIVCHNVNFDKNVIKAEFIKSDLPDPFRNMGNYDTKKMGRSVMKKRRYKLKEIATKLYGKRWARTNEESWHNAEFDVRVTATIFKLLHSNDIKY